MTAALKAAFQAKMRAELDRHKLDGSEALDAIVAVALDVARVNNIGSGAVQTALANIIAKNGGST